MKKTLAKGFTLIELMIVIAIIAIIAAIAIPNLMQSRIQANETSAIAALRAYAGAQAIFHKGAYNQRAAGGTGFVTDPIGHGASGDGYLGTIRQYAYPFSDLHDLRADVADDATPVALISSSFAAASVPETSWNGYFFNELTMTAPNANTFDLGAGPAVHAQTGNNAFRINLSGTVRQVDLGATPTADGGELTTAILDAEGWIDS